MQNKTNKQEQEAKIWICGQTKKPRALVKIPIGKEKQWEHNVLQNCQLFKTELVKKNWKVSKGCLFALLFIMATALYKLPYTIVFAFTLIYLPFLDRFCQTYLNNNLKCYMQIFPLSSLCSHMHTTQSLTANCVGILYAVSLRKKCCFAFRQKRFDFLECHPETQEIEGGKQTSLLWHIKTIVSLGIHHTPHSHSLLHLHAELSGTQDEEPDRENWEMLNWLTK